MALEFKIDHNPGATVSEKADIYSSLEQKRKSAAADGEHRRTQWVENALVIGLIVIGGVVALVYVAAIVIVAMHNLTSTDSILNWLEPAQVHKLEAIIFSSSSAAILGAIGRKYVRLSH